MPSASHDRIARRLRALRDERGFTQRQLADRMGFGHRQTVASVEAGERALRPEELARAAQVLGVEVDTFTDPFLLVGEGRFSFRTHGVGAEVLEAFRERAGRWVAAHRTLLEWSGLRRSRFGWKLDLTSRSSFEDAHVAAEELRSAWKLGPLPADSLPGAIERKLGTHVLFVDAPHGVSGAAVQVPGLHAILVNRYEPAGRRHFDLAHELFHHLTWDTMPPDPVEPIEVPARKGNRAERLAENFASALLMPADVVRRRWEQRGEADLHDWLNATAIALRVTSVALKWRMLVLGLVSRREVDALDDQHIAANGEREGEPPPPPFNRDFVTRMYDAVESGRMSLGRAARLLGKDASGLADVCRQYGLEVTYQV